MSRGEADSWDQSRGAEIYADVAHRGVLHRTLARRLADLLRPRPGSRLLDLGAGTGLTAEVLLARVGRGGQVVELDTAAAMLRIAARGTVSGSTGFVVGDPGALPLADGAFGGAVCSAAFWHFPAPGRVFAEVARALTSRGLFAFNVPAAQLEDVHDLPPAPLQLALAREGERLFGRAPAAGGPMTRRTVILELARSAGFALRAESQGEVTVPQKELVDLLEVPAIGARLYGEASSRDRQALFDAATRRVDLAELVPCRWFEFLVQKG